jgi:hypothetical protein
MNAAEKQRQIDRMKKHEQDAKRSKRGAINTTTLANDESPGKIGENIGFTDMKTPHGLVAELADATDSKSVVLTDMRVRFPPRPSLLLQHFARCRIRSKFAGSLCILRSGAR